jgi:8-hydroxy-5-deazaflavin:NADPH oxidoreductase
MMRIGILGTGTLAGALGTRWARAGHDLAVGGRSRFKALALAERLGGGARALTPREVIIGRNAVLLAVLWDGVEDMLRSAGAADGTLRGIPLIDPTNDAEHGVGVLRTGSSGSAAQRIAARAPGAHGVKAFHLFPAGQWTRPEGQDPATVAMCGDNLAALQITSQLVRDAGGRPAVLGALSRARQLEEVAGFVIGLAFAGFDPSSAVPRVPSPGAGDADQADQAERAL